MTLPNVHQYLWSDQSPGIIIDITVDCGDNVYFDVASHEVA
jgi:hypothetical protein